MSAGNINVPQSRSSHFSQSLNARQGSSQAGNGATTTSQTKMKAGTGKKIN